MYNNEALKNLDLDIPATTLYQNAKGKQIKDLGIADNQLVIIFTDYTKIRIFDELGAPSGRKYLHTDDDLEYFIGAEFLGVQKRFGAELYRSGEYYSDRNRSILEIAFLLVYTTEGVFTIVNYNEHNGYYSGFDITIED